jgi:protease I
VDRAVVRDRNWVTSRQPSDLPAFTEAMLDLFSRSPSRPTGNGAERAVAAVAP